VSRPGREQLRGAFEEVPDLYDRARPSYPEKVFDDLVALANLREGARLLEIGPGTGQATAPLAKRGFEVVGVELGAQLAEAARRRLARFENVDIVNANFETWETSGEPFDAVFAFTAFHWIDPALRYERSAELLREGGALAILRTKHVLPAGGDCFWVDVPNDYAAIGEDAEPPPHPDDVEDMSEEVQASGMFRPVEVRRHLWDVTYSADEYIDVLETYSGHRRLPPELRERLYARIKRRIEATPDRSVRKTYLGILHVAPRLP
jgi:SAM-dependent methyltransferase